MKRILQRMQLMGESGGIVGWLCDWFGTLDTPGALGALIPRLRGR